MLGGTRGVIRRWPLDGFYDGLEVVEKGHVARVAREDLVHERRASRRPPIGQLAGAGRAGVSHRVSGRGTVRAVRA